MSNCESGSKIACGIRCLDPDAVEAARRELEHAGVARISYKCRLSGKEAATLLIGGRLASRLAGTVPEAGDADDARILASLYSAELCECDVATVTALPETEVVQRLRILAALRVLVHRELHGMNYYRLDSGKVHRQVGAVLSA